MAFHRGLFLAAAFVASTLLYLQTTHGSRWGLTDEQSYNSALFASFQPSEYTVASAVDHFTSVDTPEYKPKEAWDPDYDANRQFVDGLRQKLLAGQLDRLETRTASPRTPKPSNHPGPTSSSSKRATSVHFGSAMLAKSKAHSTFSASTTVPSARHSTGCASAQTGTGAILIARSCLLELEPTRLPGWSGTSRSDIASAGEPPISATSTCCTRRIQADAAGQEEKLACLKKDIYSAGSAIIYTNGLELIKGVFSRPVSRPVGLFWGLAQLSTPQSSMFEAITTLELLTLLQHNRRCDSHLHQHRQGDCFYGSAFRDKKPTVAHDGRCRLLVHRHPG